jgi:hypothetical protein
MGTGSFPGVKRGRGVTLTPHPLLMPWSCTEPQSLYKGALYFFFYLLNTKQECNHSNIIFSKTQFNSAFSWVSKTNGLKRTGALVGKNRYLTGDEQFLVSEEQRQLAAGNPNCTKTVDDNTDCSILTLVCRHFQINYTNGCSRFDLFQI